MIQDFFFYYSSVKLIPSCCPFKYHNQDNNRWDAWGEVKRCFKGDLENSTTTTPRAHSLPVTLHQPPFTMPRPAIKLLILKARTKGDWTGLKFMVVLEVSSQTPLLFVKGGSFSSLVTRRKKIPCKRHICHFSECLNCSLSRKKTHVAPGKQLITCSSQYSDLMNS